MKKKKIRIKKIQLEMIWIVLRELGSQRRLIRRKMM